MIDCVYDHAKSASSMDELFIRKLLYILVNIKIPLHTHSIFSYIYIYHILKCFDVVMHMLSKIWKTLYTNTKLISKSGDTRPTLVQISFWPK
jgi:hypothetical protein